MPRISHTGVLIGILVLIEIPFYQGKQEREGETMIDYRFERDCRTPYSEAYVITAEDEQVGRIDLHFATHAVTATLCVGENMTAEEVRDLIDLIDDEIVLPTDVPRDDFCVTVFQGRETGVFSDEELDEESEEFEE